MRKIADIYKEYKIMPELGEHMFRVAAVASMICDNFKEPLHKNEIILACLFHDMGNIIKFNMGILPEFFEPEGVEYWQSIKDEYIKKYGTDEHLATVQIMKEIGVLDNVILLADQNRFSLICAHRDAKDINIKILHYADGRVDPHGIVSYDDRMEDARKRYQNHSHSIDEEKRQMLVDCGKEIEKQIFEKCKIKPEDITDESVAGIIEELRNFVIE